MWPHVGTRRQTRWPAQGASPFTPTPARTRQGQVSGPTAGVSAVLTPATDVIMSSVPAGKAGVGSAINDSTREIGGTLGIAVMGSIFASVYRTRVGDDISDLGLGPAATRAAEESIGAATSLAESTAGSTGLAVVDAAREAFMAGMSLSMLIAAVLTGVGAAAIWFRLPDRAVVAAGAEMAEDVRTAAA